MSQYVESACKSFTAGGALGKCLRVILSTGKLALAGITNREIGTMEKATFADLDEATVRLRSAQGTFKAVAAKAFAAGADIYTAANGKVSDTAAATSFYLGTALEAATADGDIVECLRGAHGDTAVSGT
jgi:hypothetical protein